MTKCPKCGSTKIEGPRYGNYPKEHLKYWCSICLFPQTGPTLEQQEVTHEIRGLTPDDRYMS